MKHDLLIRLTGAGRPSRGVILLLAAACLLLSGAARAQQIGKIEIQGNRYLDEETVKSFIGSKEGEAFSEDQVTEDIHSLYASGLIQDVVVDKSWTKSGTMPKVVLTYTIVEKPMIREVRFEGNKELNEDDIKGISDIKNRSVYDPVKIREVRYKLLEEYARRGFFMAKVDVEAVEVSDGQVDVVFWISEGKKPVVRDIVFFGNQEIKSRKLRGVMTTKKEGAFQAKPYSREDFLRDQYVIDFYYEDNGYLESAFEPSERLLSQDRESVSLGLGIEEGPQYSVGEITVDGDLLVPAEKIMEGFSLESGEIFRKSLMIKDQQYLLDLYGVEGYALCLAEPELKLDHDRRIVDVAWHITKGPKVYIERIEVSGNQKTYDKVVRRELLVKEGQLFNTAATRKSEARVKQLGYFSEVMIVPKRGSDENRVNLDVLVKEARSGSLSAGAGMSTADQYFFSLQYQQQNFAGLGMDVSVQAMISDRTQNYYLRYSDPYFLDSDWHLGLEGFSTQTYYIQFINSRRGGSVTLGHRVPHFDNLRAYVGYSYVVTNLESFSQSSTIYRKQPSDTAIGSMTFTLDRNQLNNYIDPSDGSKITTTVEVAGHGLFGGDHDFVKSRVEGWYFQPALSDTYFAFRARGSMMSYDQGDELLISERYFQGGQYSLRGYEVGSVSPMFREDDGGLTPIGGNKEVLFTAEYLVPVSPEMGMKLAFFYDAGNVYNDNQDVDLSGLYQDWGFGLRWFSPMGPLRFELAFPLDKRPSDDPQQFVFSVGRMF